MTTFAKSLKRQSRKILNGLMLATALGSAGLAQADVLNFEQPVDMPVLFDYTETVFGNFFVDTYGYNTGSGDLAGLVIDGSDSGACSLQCPVNNSSNYMAMLADSYFVFGKNDLSSMRLKSMDVSFIGSGLTSYPAVSGLLILAGFNANFDLVFTSQQIAVPGPSTTGNFAFSTIDLSAYSALEFTAVRVLGFACDAAGNCTRGNGLAQFAYDNITTLDAVTVPEPASLALFGLAAAGLIAGRRRAARSRAA